MRIVTGRLAGAPPGAVLDEADVLVVLDGARRLRSLPGMVQVLRDGPSVGVYAVCVDSDERLLPEECQAVVVQEATGARVQQTRTAVVEGVRPDLVSPAWCARVARALAPLRDVSRDSEQATLPSSCRLLELMGLDPPSPEAIAARWALAGRSTEAVLGESMDGPFSLDLRRDGPHGLIAGTTGAGKSELLQSLVASLAVANRPDALTFVLIDYKGGAAFAQCERLPHTVGMVTDLDTHLVERALESLGAELRRREHQLAAAGAKDIDDYVDLLRNDPSMEAMPRLVIVIDEFASMVRELPDFVTGMVNIAQRGRSLGIHLILATQRPSGVVSPEIRANTNLRVALRVTDSSESSDVIDAPDAGRISKATPGRAYARLGHSSLVAFQTGRVGGRRPGTVTPQPCVLGCGDRVAGPLGRAGAGAAHTGRSRRRGDHRPPGARRGDSLAPSALAWRAQPRAARGCPRCRNVCCSKISPRSCSEPQRRQQRCRPWCSASRTFRPSSFGGRPPSTSRGSPICTSSAPPAAVARRRCAPSRDRSRTGARRPTCTSTASTAATARCCRSPGCRTAERWSRAPRPSGRPG